MKTSVQQIQEIQDLLQETKDAADDFFKLPGRNERALNFLGGKAFAYVRVLEILAPEKEEIK